MTDHIYANEISINLRRGDLCFHLHVNHKTVECGFLLNVPQCDSILYKLFKIYLTRRILRNANCDRVKVKHVARDIRVREINGKPVFFFSFFFCKNENYIYIIQNER